jgi:DNA polymerase-4
VDHLAARLRQVGVQARTVELKVRSSDFRTRIRSLSLTDATDSTQSIWQAALSLLERSITADILPVRLLGVGATNLTRDPTVQGHLFEDEKRRRQAALDQAIDAIRQQLGATAIQRGSLFHCKPEEKPDTPA